MSINFDCKYNLNKKNTEIKTDINSYLGGFGGKCKIDKNYNFDNVLKSIVLKSNNDYMDFELELYGDNNNEYSIEAKSLLNLQSDLIDGKIGLKYNKNLNNIREENNLSGIIEGGVNIHNTKIGLNYETSFNSDYIDAENKYKQKKTHLTPFIETNFKKFKGRLSYEMENKSKINKYGTISKYNNHYLNMKTNYSI